MNMKSTQLSIEWVETPGDIALVFDKRTWKVFEEVANSQEQSTKHMITRAVVACLGEIREDNMVLNQILRGSG